MGWENRKSNRYFYQHQRRPDGRKVKQYFGKGFAAHMAANFLKLRKAAKQIEAEALRRIRAETQEADELLNSYSKRVSEFIVTEMLIAGFHNPRSRGWRMIMKTESNVATECVETSKAAASKMPRRSKGDTSTGNKTAKPVSSQAPPEQHSSRSTSNGHAAGISKEEAQQFHQEVYEQFRRKSAANQTGKSCDGESDAKSADNASSPSKSVEEMSFEELRAAAERGNTTVMRRLRTLMHEDADHYRQLGDIGGRAILKWLDVHYRRNFYRRECLRMQVESKRKEHLHEGNSAIERLLVEEVLICWLRHNYWVQNGKHSPNVLAFGNSSGIDF